MFRFHPGKDVFELPPERVPDTKVRVVGVVRNAVRRQGSEHVAEASAAPGKQEAEPRTAFSLLIQHPRRFGSTEDVALMPY